MTSYIIVWLLYGVVVVYNVVDTLQTIMLIELGQCEANWFLLSLVEATGTPHVIWAAKVVPIVLLGVSLWLHFKIEASDNHTPGC